MTDNNQTEAPPPAGSGEAKPDVAQAIGAKAEDTSTAKASDELTEDALDAVAGGGPSYWNRGPKPKGSPGYILGSPIRPGS